ncbi:BppU family phage baseplate upper protein [Enterococcus faecium]|uniref:BppU family phage baseplate upper protein n=2 Tax=Enterococcus faecium TaxID=1352 RepID=UPI00338EE03E
MAHVIKKGSIKVPTQPKDYDLQATGLVFKSYDNQIALEFNVEQQNGTPADLLGANLRLLMFIYDEVDGMITKEPIPFITKNLITESFLNGQVVYILPEAMKAYNGMVEAYVYIEYPDGSTSDNLGFTFRMKRSAIDGLAQDKADYFIADFQQLLDGVKQEATDAVNETLAKVEAVSENVSSAQNDLTILEDRIDQTNQQIGDLGKLKRMYSNSIDFGEYDYSGNPNLIPPISFASLGRVNDKTDTNIPGVTDGGSYFEVNTEVSLASSISSVFVPFQPRLQPNKTYTLTVSLEYDQAFIDSGASHSISYGAKINGVIERPVTIIGAKTTTAKQTISKTFTTSTIYGNGQAESFYQLWFATTSKGKIKVYYDFKLEEGSKATPYQPNLLDDPYWLGKVPLGENIADPTKTFPIKSSGSVLYQGNMTEPFVVGETYTITVKGTKPSTQLFGVFNPGISGYGNLSPVEGLTDVWSLTFTPNEVSTDPKILQIVQTPNASVGACQIDWLKIEKGDTRTPNISEYKYFGEGLKDSNNPNDYSWDITAEYTEKGLNDSVSLTEPQSVDGTKNFLETPLVNGKNVLVEEKPLPYEAWHSTGTEQTGISNKARLIIGPVATTIGAKLNRSMKENPLSWNSGNWQATANRDCTLLVEGLVRYQFGGSTAGQYGYITFYKDDAQTSSIGFAGGVGINGTALQWKYGLHFSRIFALKKGEYFNITFETQDGKKLDFSQINTLHIMEIES